MAMPNNGGSDDRPSPVQGEVRELAKLVAGISDIEVWAVAYLIWKQRMLTGTPSLRAIADAIGVGKDTVYDRLQRFERMFPEVSFKNAEGLDDGGPGKLFHKIRDLLDRIDSILQIGRSGKLTITLGAGQGLCNSWVRQVVRPFMVRHRDRKPRVSIKLATDLPKKIRDDGDRGLLDLYVTSWPDDREENGEVVMELKLNFQLICPYDHPAVDKPGLESLRDTTVIVLARHDDRIPRPRYPIVALEDAGAKIEEVLTYDVAYSKMRLGDSRIACFGLSEILNDEDKREFVGVRLEDFGLEIPPVRICLVAPERARRRREPEFDQLVDELVGDFKTFLENVKKSIRDDLLDEFNDRSNPWRTYHVRRLGKSGDPFWAGGSLNWRFSRDGSLRGTHRVGLREFRGAKRADQEFQVYGQLMLNDSYKECHLAWQGVFDGFGEPTRSKHRETYDASFVFPQKALDIKEKRLEAKEPIVGVWQGRRTYPSEGSERYMPDWGYMVLCRRELERTASNAEWLYTKVREYQKECGINPEKDLPVPEEWEEDLLAG